MAFFSKRKKNNHPLGIIPWAGNVSEKRSEKSKESIERIADKKKKPSQLIHGGLRGLLHF